MSVVIPKDERDERVLRSAMKEWLDNHEDTALHEDVDAMYAMYTKLCQDMRDRS